MSNELDRVEKKLLSLREGEVDKAALRIIDALSVELETIRAELLYQNLPEAPTLTEDQIKEFSAKARAHFQDMRIGDLAVVYDSSTLAQYRPETRLALCEILVSLTNEKKLKVPKLWTTVVESRGHAWR